MTMYDCGCELQKGRSANSLKSAESEGQPSQKFGNCYNLHQPKFIPRISVKLNNYSFALLDSHFSPPLLQPPVHLEDP